MLFDGNETLFHFRRFGFGVLLIIGFPKRKAFSGSSNRFSVFAKTLRSFRAQKLQRSDSLLWSSPLCCAPDAKIAPRAGKAGPAD
ncbi:MAG: hypothetical protein IK140_01200 [Clostridia bacterium]|nr:hypothetical protein [Clostridia bacterium]